MKLLNDNGDKEMSQVIEEMCESHPRGVHDTAIELNGGAILILGGMHSESEQPAFVLACNMGKDEPIQRFYFSFADKMAMFKFMHAIASMVTMSMTQLPEEPAANNVPEERVS